MYLLKQKHHFRFKKNDIVFPPCVVWRRSSILPSVTIAEISVHFLWWHWGLALRKGRRPKRTGPLLSYDEWSKYGSSHVDAAISMSACAEPKPQCAHVFFYDKEAGEAVCNRCGYVITREETRAFVEMALRKPYEDEKEQSDWRM